MQGCSSTSCFSPALRDMPFMLRAMRFAPASTERTRTRTVSPLLTTLVAVLTNLSCRASSTMWISYSRHPSTLLMKRFLATHRQLRDVHQAIPLGTKVDKGTKGVHLGLWVEEADVWLYLWLMQPQRACGQRSMVHRMWLWPGFLTTTPSNTSPVLRLARGSFCAFWAGAASSAAAASTTTRLALLNTWRLLTGALQVGSEAQTSIAEPGLAASEDPICSIHKPCCNQSAADWGCGLGLHAINGIERLNSWVLAARMLALLCS
jgi:hypothetical protein